jgi:hypothetical protein
MRYVGYDFLNKLMEALMNKDKTSVVKMAEDLKVFLIESEELDKRLFVSDLIDIMERWAYEMGIAKRFRSALFDIIYNSDI